MLRGFPQIFAFCILLYYHIQSRPDQNRFTIHNMLYLIEWNSVCLNEQQGLAEYIDSSEALCPQFLDRHIF